MSCKSCKKNKGGVVKSINDFKTRISEQSSNPTNSVTDDEHKLFDYEKVLLTIFGWGPLVVGYYHIVKFVINLF